MQYGIVYLLTNPCMPGLVKIGITTQEDIDKRRSRNGMLLRDVFKELYFVNKDRR